MCSIYIGFASNTEVVDFESLLHTAVELCAQRMHLVSRSLFLGEHKLKIIFITISFLPIMKIDFHHLKFLTLKCQILIFTHLHQQFQFKILFYIFHSCISIFQNFDFSSAHILFSFIFFFSRFVYLFTVYDGFNRKLHA